MTDIVERLCGHPGEGQTVTEQFRNMVEQRREAAGEIERLRAAIAYMNEHADSPTIIRREARRALEPKP